MNAIAIDWSGLPTEILADVASTAVVASVAFVAFFLASLSKRRRLFDFFGISRSRRAINCYVSLLQFNGKVEPSLEKVENGYKGPAMNRIEYVGATRIADLFSSKLLAFVPRGIRKISSGAFLSWTPVSLEILTSPDAEVEIAEDKNLVVVGGSPYNNFAKYVLDSPMSFFEFTRIDKNRAFRPKRARGDSVQQTGTPPELIKGRTGDAADNHEQGIIQRLKYPSGRTVLHCAGLGSNATMNTACYLVENWPRLHREANGRDFGVLLVFVRGDADSDDVRGVLTETLFFDPPISRELPSSGGKNQSGSVVQ